MKNGTTKALLYVKTKEGIRPSFFVVYDCILKKYYATKGYKNYIHNIIQINKYYINTHTHIYIYIYIYKHDTTFTTNIIISTTIDIVTLN